MTFRRLSVLIVDRLTYSRNFNVPGEGPSESRDEYSRSRHGYHHALRGGTTGTSYPQSSSLQPGAPEGYDIAPQASQHPPIGLGPPTEFVPIYSVQSTASPYSSGFIRQQFQRQMNLAWPSSQGSAGAWNLLPSSNSHQSNSKSHPLYNNGGFRYVRQQNPRPIAPAPPFQGPAGVQNAWAPFPQVYLNFPFCASLLLKIIGLRWSLRSGKRLSYVSVKQNTEHAY